MTNVSSPHHAIAAPTPSRCTAACLPMVMPSAKPAPPTLVATNTPVSTVPIAPPHTPWPIGTYPGSRHRALNHSTALRRMRSAKPPMISAGVMIANVS